MFSNEGRTELSNLGEFGLIDRIEKACQPKLDQTKKGIGDDAAVFQNSEGMQTVISTDMLVEGVHFDLMYCPLKHLGYKAVSVNLSDIYAMNATPKQITVSIALSNRFSLEAIDELYSGILVACDAHNVDLVGGDTTSSRSGLVISITAIGEAKEEEIVYRDGAQENDLLIVSGDLGSAYIGLQILEREKSVYKENPEIQPDLAGHDYVLERQLKPEARKDIFELLKKMEVKPTSMIDISDGLASEVLHLAHKSGLGCNVFDEKLPIDPIAYNTARDFELDPNICALNGGEDYELLFTIKQSDWDKVKGNPNLTAIGHMTTKGAGSFLVDSNGGAHELKAQGWDAFLSAKGKNEENNNTSEQ